MLTTKSIAWLAGILEGEGHFPQPPAQIGIALKMTDSDIVHRAAYIMGMKESDIRTRKKQKPQHKDQYCIQLSGQRAAGWMMTLFTLMGERRKQQIQGALKKWLTKPPQRLKNSLVCIRGHSLEGYNVCHNSKGSIMCRACRMANQRRYRSEQHSKPAITVEELLGLN